MARPKRVDRSTVADSPLTIRLTAAERGLLDALIKLRQEQLGRDAKVSQGSYLRALIYEKAEAHGIKGPPEPPPTATKSNPVQAAEAKPNEPPKKSTEAKRAQPKRPAS